MDGQGTPKTLLQAIANGVAATPSVARVQDIVYFHVLDYLAQQFQIAILEAETDKKKEEADRLHKLFEKITMAYTS